MTQINQNYKRKFQILVHLFKTENRKQKTEIENKISSISGLATNSALIAVENKIRNVSSLVKKKPDRNTAISEIEKTLTDHNHDEYITTPEFNNLAAGVFDARLKQANLVTRTEFDTRLTSLNEKK